MDGWLFAAQLVAVMIWWLEGAGIEIRLLASWAQDSWIGLQLLGDLVLGK